MKVKVIAYHSLLMVVKFDDTIYNKSFFLIFHNLEDERSSDN